MHREEDLPRTVLQRGSIQRGSVITFVRGQEGRVTASAGGVELASVHSPHLAAALFDLYIGEQVGGPEMYLCTDSCFGSSSDVGSV